MENIDDIVVKNVNSVYGNTTINHAIRVKLGLSMAEYCVMDFIEYANSKRKLVTYEYALRRIGVEKDQIIKLIASLIEKEFLKKEDKDIQTTRKWMDAFMLSEEWFEAFWNVNGKPYWPGSKKDAQKKFVQLCKKYTPEYIIQCRNDYVRFMNHPKNSFRTVMGGPVFLNPETERFKEDWKLQLLRMDGKGMELAKKPELTANAKEALFK